ncbi:unnamed protein product [Urochloa humidicola]
MDPQLQKILDELKSVRNSVADLKSSLTSRIDGVEKALGDRFQRLTAPTTSSSSSASTPTPAARGVVVDINNTTLTRCSTQVSSADAYAPAFVTTAPTISAAVYLIDVGEKLVQYGPIDSKSTDAECVDRLSFLPVVLLCDIVSRLPIKDAARTVVLSRRWRPIWRVRPSDAPSAVDKTNKHNTKVAVDLRASYDCLMHVPRYITSMTPSLSNGMVLLCAGIGGYGYEKALESSILFGPVHAYVFDKEKWPPPIHYDMQRSEVKLRPIPWPSFTSDTVWDITCLIGYFTATCVFAHVKNGERGEFTLSVTSQGTPLQVVIVQWKASLLMRLVLSARQCSFLKNNYTLLTGSVQHRPIPLPSFTSHTMAACSTVNQSMVETLMGDISRECLQLELELYEMTVQIDGSQWKDI